MATTSRLLVPFGRLAMDEINASSKCSMHGTPCVFCSLHIGYDAWGKGLKRVSSDGRASYTWAHRQNLGEAEVLEPLSIEDRCAGEGVKSRGATSRAV